MAQALKYKRPRKFNVVTIALILIAMLIVFLLSQYIPLYFREQEAYRILDETSSQFAGKKNRYLASDPHIMQLQERMANDLRLVGITDPDMEYWIEVDNKNTVRFGVVYGETITWPWDIIPPQSKEVELEYTLALTW
jgi:hypothetical protein